ncbi:MAG: RHS repeat-associated core domain-containing protein [Planctomycetes bacterium]|nr:RHS repeat-associated core domain-containing protein [Planctomycetota bacterium]
MQSATDLMTGQGGVPWGHTRSYTNALPYPVNAGNGWNWQVAEWPYVVGNPTGTVTIMGASQNVLWFDAVGSGYVARFNVRDSLRLDSVNQQYVWTMLDGTVTRFSSNTGAFISRSDTAGNTVSIYSSNTNNSNPTEVRRTFTGCGSSAIESLVYTYDNGASALPNLTNLLLRRSSDGGNTWSNVSQVTYTYYNAGDTFGIAGDLQTVTTANWSGTGWENTGTTLYRYYPQPIPTVSSSSSSSSSSGTGGGGPIPPTINVTAQHLLQFVVLPASYVQLAAFANPLTASNSTVLQFADYCYFYDGNNRVIGEIVKQGSQTYGFSATSSGNVNGYNNWATKTIETLPDGNQNIVYSNYAGQTMLKVFQAVGTSSSSSSSSSSGSGPAIWCTYYQYDANANLILQANPSAVTGYDDTKADLVNWQGTSAQYLKQNAGLIKTYTYDPASTQVSAEMIQQGTAGLPIILRQYQYIACCTASSSSSSSSRSSSSSSSSSSSGAALSCIYFLSKLIEYPDDGSSSSSSSSSSSGSSGTANGNTRQIITTYAYTFWPGTCAIQQKTTTWPVISAAQNGSGVAAQMFEYFDACGNLLWKMDERGFIFGMSYDVPTGSMIQRIDDVNTALVNAPAGWSTPAGGGLHLITDYSIDAQGRQTQSLGPWHTIDIGGVATSIRRANWTVYQDGTFQTWSGQGYATGVSSSSSASSSSSSSSPNYSFTLINPVGITITDAQGRVTDQIQAVRYASGAGSSSSSSSSSSSASCPATAPVTTAGALSAFDSFPQCSYVRWTTTQYSDCCFVASQRVYKLIPATGTGVSGTNYDEMDFGYDIMKRQNLQVTPGGTITRTVFDAMGRTIGTWVGTNDTGATSSNPAGSGAPNNMVIITGVVYDNGTSGGDSNVTQKTDYVDATGLNDRVTTFLYDFRDRRTDTDGEIDFYAKQYYDNMDRVTKQERYNTNLAGNLIGRNTTSYDDRNRVFQFVTYAVDPATGVVGNALTSKTWYDASGNTVKSLPAGSQASSKSVYDSHGRQTTRYACYNYSDTTYATAISVTGDTILEQVETVYDAASNVIQTNFRQRYHSATGTGPLGSASSSQPQARVMYTANYADAIGRQQAIADYGTNGGTALNRSATIPARSDTCLVTSTTFNARGESYLSTDPAGTVKYQVFDDTGRRISLVENYIVVSSSSSSSSSSNTCAAGDDTNRTTNITYTADNLQATITAVNLTTGNQTTTYQYGTTLSASAVASTLLKVAEIYPDSVSGSDQKTFAYNRQSQVATLTDQNGSVHTYTYDLLGRQIDDGVTTLGTGVDGAVRRIATSYEVRGLVQNITSYDNATVGSGNVVNEVQKSYNSFGQLVTEYQSHSGAVNVSTTPNVQYGYASGSSNTIRPTSITYPNGRVVNYDYGTSQGMNDALSRIGSLIDNDGVTHLADYSYLGMNSIIQVNEPQPAIQFTLVGIQTGNDPATGDIYRGLDQFGRVKDLIWVPTGSSSSSSSSNSSSAAGTNLVRIQHSYDRAGNRLYRKDLVAENYNAGLDEIYGYDGLYRLKSVNRGRLNPTNTAISTGTGTFTQCWTLDSTGNWKGFREDDKGNGTWNVVQSRSANLVNEITAIINSVGSAWGQPAYDKNGNMTTIPQPANPSSTYAGEYDAWNRLVTLSDPTNGNTLQTNLYDGRSFRALRNTFAAGILAESRHYYFSLFWQPLEERVGASPAAEQHLVWGLQQIDDIVLRDRSTTGILDERLYSLNDPLYSITALIDSVGTSQERYQYLPYGCPQFLSSTFAPRSGTLFDWESRFAGYQADNGTSLYNVRERVLHYALGNWITRDYSPYRIDLYQYVRARPTFFSDPFGLEEVQIDFPVIGDDWLPWAQGTLQVYIDKQCDKPDMTFLFDKLVGYGGGGTLGLGFGWDWVTSFTKDTWRCCTGGFEGTQLVGRIAVREFMELKLGVIGVGKTTLGGGTFYTIPDPLVIVKRIKCPCIANKPREKCCIPKRPTWLFDLKPWDVLPGATPPSIPFDPSSPTIGPRLPSGPNLSPQSPSSSPILQPPVGVPNPR